MNLLLLEKYDLIYHLSHSDLDGYGSQYITNIISKTSLFSKNNKIIFKNSNNYKDTDINIKQIFKEIISMKNKKTYKKSKKILLLITDLSIKENTAKKMNNFKRGNKDINIDFLVFDHHKTTKKLIEENEWYFLNINKCATKIYSEYIINILKFYKNNINKEIINHLELVSNVVNSMDLWLSSDKYFHKANLLSDTLFNFNFPLSEEFEEIKNIKREFIFNYIYLYMQNINEDIEKIEEKLPKLLINTINIAFESKYSYNIIEKELNILSSKNLLYKYISKYINEKKLFEKYTESKINIFGYKGIILFEENSNLFQYFSHYYLEENTEIDLILNVKRNGSISFRSIKNNIDVEIISKKLDINGGGHKHAAGCKIKFKKDIHSLKELNKELKSYINVKGEK